MHDFKFLYYYNVFVYRKNTKMTQFVFRKMHHQTFYHYIWYSQGVSLGLGISFLKFEGQLLLSSTDQILNFVVTNDGKKEFFKSIFIHFYPRSIIT